MKISLNWLKDYVSVKIPPEKLAHHLTMAGLEVEKISSVNGDIVFELEITPNRPDCLSLWGMARETAAVFNKSLRLPKTKKIKPPRRQCAITVEDRKGCPRYIGHLMEDVGVAPAPEWIRTRLEALGGRAVNNVVDITNFCLWETGQPLHAFDYEKISGGKIIVRRAREGEKIVTIDGVERRLDPSILVIADVYKPVAIAGIMGGKETEVTACTRKIFLESAYFDPALIRRASRRLGLMSDSSYRFERGVDYGTVEEGARRVVSLILEEAGGKVTACRDTAVGRGRKAAKTIVLSVLKLNRYLGTCWSASYCRDILQRLGFGIRLQSQDILHVTPPSFRVDVKEEVDVIEEAARIAGYDHLPQSLPLIKAGEIPEEPRRLIRRAVNHLLIAQGFNEVVTYAMINAQSLQRSGQGGLEGVRIQNPLTQEQEMMRPSLLPSLLPVVLFNGNRGQKDLKIFETGKIYTPQGEREVLGLVMTGLRSQDWRLGRKEAVHFYDLKGVLEQTLERLGKKAVCFESSDQPFFEGGQGAVVKMEDIVVGILGKIKDSVLGRWDIKSRSVLFAQMDLEALGKEFSRERIFTPVPAYPAAVRDVSLAVKKDIHFRQVEEIARRVGGDLLVSLQFNEEYLGEKIPAGCRGVVFSLHYQSRERTLREEEVNALHEKIVGALAGELGAVRR